MKKRMNNPIGIYEKAIPNKFDWASKIKLAKEAGYDFIEMSIDESDQRLNRLYWSYEKRQYIKQLLADHDFHINSICLSGHRRFPFGSHDEKTRQKAYFIMDQAIGLAQDLGIRNIQLAGYDVYYEESDDKTKEWFIDGLKYAAKQAASASVMLSIEIMDTSFIGTISKCMRFIQEVGSPWLQIYPDLGNLSQWTKEPAKELALGLNHIVAIHLKDTQPGVFKNVPFGDGTVDFKGLFDQLDHLGFQGPFLVEMWADNDQDPSYEDSLNNIVEAKQWLINQSGDRFYV